jgi:ABC-type sulfate transport system permease component
MERVVCRRRNRGTDDPDDFGDCASLSFDRGLGWLWPHDLSEVAAVVVGGGNIAGYTRIITTAIVLKTSEGELRLALGLGLVLAIQAARL